jgi:hypothetical protein
MTETGIAVTVDNRCLNSRQLGGAVRHYRANCPVGRLDPKFIQ